MKLLIAKHYWVDGVSAKWEKHSNIDEGIFSYLQSNYADFVQKRPRSIVHNGYYIYMCYEDKYDTYGRKIVPITFYVAKKQIGFNPCSLSTTKMEISVNNSKDVTFKLLGLIGILLVLVIVFLASKSENVDNEKSEVPATHQTESAIQKKSSPVCKDDDIQKIMHKDSLQYCFESFIKEKCNTNYIDGYTQWLKSKKSKIPSCFTIDSFEDDKDIDILFREKKYRKFFIGDNSGI